MRPCSQQRQRQSGNPGWGPPAFSSLPLLSCPFLPPLKTPPSLVKSQYGLDLSYWCHPIVSFLVLIMHSGYVRCYRWGKLGEGCTGTLCTIFATSFDSKIISKSKSLLKKYPRLQDPPKCRFSTKRLRLSHVVLCPCGPPVLCAHIVIAPVTSYIVLQACRPALVPPLDPDARGQEPLFPSSGTRTPSPTSQPPHRVLGTVGAQ